MKLFYRSITLLSISFFIFSCGSNNPDGITVKEKNFTKKTELRSDSIGIDRELNPFYFKQTKNGFVIFSPDNEDGAVNVFSVPGFNLKYAQIRRGRGPGEFLGLNWADSKLEDVVTIYDITNKVIRSLDVLADTLTLRNEYKITATNKDGLTMPYAAMIQLDDSFFITRAVDRTSHAVELWNMATGENTAIIPDPLDRDPKEEQYVNYDYHMGYGNDCLVKAYETLDRIEIIENGKDNSFSSVCLIQSKNWKSELGLDPDDRKIYYLGLFCSDKYIYALRWGKMEDEEGSSSIEVYNYNGDAVAELLLDRIVSIFHIDESNNLIYALDPYVGSDYLYTYNIAGLL